MLSAGIMAFCAGCASQSGNAWRAWVASLTHPAAPPPAVAPQTASKGQQFRDIEPEVSAAPVPAAGARIGAEQPKPRPPEPAAAQSPPVPTVTSAMSGATRQEAEAAINEVDKRLALAGGSGDGKSQQITVIRKLRDSAQQALEERDYLTAQSLAQKASILASQLPGAGQSTPSH